MLASVSDPIHILRAYREGVSEALAETLWPTRCARCEVPGDVLCDRCRRELPYLDWWRACPRCGAPFGRVQCSECNPVVLAHSGRDHLPYDACASATVFDDDVARIIRTYKDLGERRLATPLSAIMAHAVDPSWKPSSTVHIPSSSAALRRRGFDHGKLLTASLAKRLDLPHISALSRPRSRDQRSLSRHARLTNMTESFGILPGVTVPNSILLVDDVYTTGATLFDATDVLHRAGAEHVWCITFARVW